MTGTALLAGVLAAAAVLLLTGPRPAALRLQDVLGSGGSGQGGGSGTRHRGQEDAAGLDVRLRSGGLRLVVGGLLVGLGLSVGPVAAALALCAVLAGRRWWAARGRARAVAAERRAVVEACAVLAAELRAGRASGQGLHAAAAVAVGPSREVLRAGAASAGLGGDVAGALAAVPPDCAVPDVLRSLAACWSVCAETGSGLAAAVDRLEEGLRADEVLRQALAAELAGPRATAGLLAVLPVVGLLLAAALGADPLQVLLHTPLGLLCLVAGVGLDALGVLWTDRLVRRAGG